MKQFIVLTAITGELIAIRPSEIRCITERKCIEEERIEIYVKSSSSFHYNISAEKHSVESIVNEVEAMGENGLDLKD